MALIYEPLLVAINVTLQGKHRERGPSLGSDHEFWLNLCRTNLYKSVCPRKSECSNPHCHICRPKLQICKDWALRMVAFVSGVQGGGGVAT